MNDIEIRHLFKSFGEKHILQDISATFEAGKTTCIMGPSGCGKTTLARILAGLETFDTGSISNVPKKVSFIFQEDRLSENYSALSNLRFVAGRSVSREQLLDLLAAFELEDFSDQPVSTLSGGMKRRVAIARALCAPYDLLIMDEPLKGLDEQLKEHVMQLLKERTEGKTVICVTHDPAEADFLGGNILHMERTR